MVRPDLWKAWCNRVTALLSADQHQWHRQSFFAAISLVQVAKMVKRLVKNRPLHIGGNSKAPAAAPNSKMRVVLPSLWLIAATQFILLLRRQNLWWVSLAARPSVMSTFGEILAHLGTVIMGVLHHIGHLLHIWAHWGSLAHLRTFGEILAH